MSQGGGVRKKSLGRAARMVRGIGALVDPRAWLHMVKIINYYNYTHVAPLREMRVGASPSISPDAVFSNAVRIEIGDRVRIGSRCHIWAGPGTGQIRIGHDVLFGPEVMVTAASYDYNHGAPVTDQPMIEADIEIGDDVWLATRAVILPGARIGNGAVVAAGAVVKGEVPAFASVAGSPARIVGQREIR